MDDEPEKKTKVPVDQRGARAGQTTMVGSGNGVANSVPGRPQGSIGQKPYVPTDRDREYVKKHVFYAGQERVARRLGISRSTLVKHFRAEIDESYDELLDAGGKTAMKMALEGDGPMLRFVLSSRFPDLWSHKYKLGHEGKIEVEQIDVDYEKFFEGKSKDEIADIIRGLALVASAGGIIGSGGPDPSDYGGDEGDGPDGAGGD